MNALTARTSVTMTYMLLEKTRRRETMLSARAAFRMMKTPGVGLATMREEGEGRKVLTASGGEHFILVYKESLGWRSSTK